MQEAEIKHARLAMLAAVGWPVAEMLAPDFMLNPDGRVPSLLNGGLVSFTNGGLPLFSVLGLLAAFAKFEQDTAFKFKGDTKLGKLHQLDMGCVWEYGIAGDANFDPLNLYSERLCKDAGSRKAMRDLELAHGRAAMLGITGYVILEALTHTPIVKLTPDFFHPNVGMPILLTLYWWITQSFEVTDPTKHPIKVQWRKGMKQSNKDFSRLIGPLGKLVNGGN
jgi:hypothetical protein